MPKFIFWNDMWNQAPKLPEPAITPEPIVEAPEEDC